MGESKAISRIEQACLLALDAVSDTAYLVVFVALKFYALLGIIAAGIVCIWVRDVFLWLCPVMLRISGVLTPVINAIIIDASLIIDEIIVVVDVLSFRKVASPFWPKLISDQEFREVVSSLPVLCRDFDTMPAIMDYTFKYTLHDYTCSVARYLYPVGWLYDGFNAVVGWTYYGDAEPNPNDDTENCEHGSDSRQLVCVGLGVGYIIMELLVPLILFFLFWSAYGQTIRKTIYQILLLVVETYTVSKNTFYGIIHAVGL